MTLEKHSLMNDLESNFRNFLEHTLEGVWVLDLSKNAVFANTRMGDILGAEKDDFKAERLWDFIPADDESILVSRIETVLKTGKSVQTQISYECPTDSPVFCILDINPVFDHSGRVSGIIGNNIPGLSLNRSKRAAN